MNGFKILTLDWTSFEMACNRLRSMVDGSGFHPDLVVGIPRAGCYLVEKGWSDCESMSIELTKSSTTTFSLCSHLKRKFGGVVRFLPLCLRDCLRIWDAKRLIKQGGDVKDITVLLPPLPESVRCLLIVDDAVDSGTSLAAVVTAVRKTYPAIIIRSAVITVTGANPIYMPDYYLYNDSILVRMPWSIDV